MSEPMHPGEQLADLVDGRLSAAEAADVRAHLEHCADCRAVHDELRAARAAARALQGDVPMPADLLASVSRALDREDESERRAEPARVPSTLRILLQVAATIAITLLFRAFVTPPRDLPRELASIQSQLGTQYLPLEIASSDVQSIERYFADAGPPRVRVIDLSMMGIVNEGGVRYLNNSHPYALMAYRLPSGARLVCQMYEGLLADLPPPAETREQNGFRFQLYRRGTLTLVFWQEGELVCVLGAELPGDEVMALAVAKAMAPS